MMTSTQTAHTMENVRLGSKHNELANIYPHPTVCDLHQSALVAESKPQRRWFGMQSLDFGQVHFQTSLCFLCSLAGLLA